MANNGHGPEDRSASMSPEAEALTALLGDLGELRDYLAARGQHTYELAQRFLHNAQRQSAERAYDERQATMLEYQHYIWHEIAGRVDQLLARYSNGAPEGSQAAELARESSDEEH
jgi:nucleotidyltransferase/DNA polymerase involved in DNA repair